MNLMYSSISFSLSNGACSTMKLLYDQPGRVGVQPARQKSVMGFQQKITRGFNMEALGGCIGQLAKGHGGRFCQSHQTGGMLTERERLPDEHAGFGRILVYPEVGGHHGIIGDETRAPTACLSFSMG